MKRLLARVRSRSLFMSVLSEAWILCQVADKALSWCCHGCVVPLIAASRFLQW
jgi:hypothetical protein